MTTLNEFIAEHLAEPQDESDKTFLPVTVQELADTLLDYYGPDAPVGFVNDDGTFRFVRNFEPAIIKLAFEWGYDKLPSDCGAVCLMSAVSNNNVDDGGMSLHHALPVAVAKEALRLYGNAEVIALPPVIANFVEAARQIEAGKENVRVLKDSILKDSTVKCETE